MRRRSVNLLEGPIAKPLLMFFFPVLLGTFFQQLYNTMDAIIVGNVVGKVALSAVGGTTGTLINLMVGFVTGLASGATVIVSQYYGNRDASGVRKAVSTSMFLAIVLGLVMTVLGVFGAPFLLSKMNVPEEVYPLSLYYMQIYMAGSVFSMIYNTGAGILRAVGDSKRPLYFLIFSCFTNIVLDILFVAIFKWGSNGAALATVASQVVSAFLTLKVLKEVQASYNYSLKDTQCDMSTLSRILVIGLPTGIQSCLYSVSNVFIQASVNTFGTDTMAAYTAFGKIDSLFWMVSGAFGTAVLTFAGQNFGAGKIDRVRKGFRVGLLLDFAISAVLALALYYGGAYLFEAFSDDPEVIRIGMGMLKFLCPYWITFIFVEVFSSGIRACGDSLATMIMTALGIGFFRIFWILFYPSVTIYDSLRCYPISWVLTGTLLTLYYLHGGWLKRSLKARERIMQNTDGR